MADTEFVIGSTPGGASANAKVTDAGELKVSLAVSSEEDVEITDITKGVVLTDIDGSGKRARLRLKRVGYDDWQIWVDEIA